MSDYEARFSGIGRLYSVSGLDRLRHSHVCVVGIGGVGSWAAEALARSGIGELTLIDLDEVCVSNVNRQLHALDGEIGQPKVEVIARRVKAINPDCIVHSELAFFTELNAKQILEKRFDYLFDAIDNVPNKCLLIAECRKRGIPIVTSGGAGGRRNPTVVRVNDLAFTSHDRLLQEIRRKLRSDYGFPTEPNTPFHVPCVYSSERVLFPQKDGSVCARRDPDSDPRLNCNSGYGTATFVTGTFGFAAAALIVAELSQAENKV
jgi:tRNA threonylcarbamoyladenosine dehydratase